MIGLSILDIKNFMAGILYGTMFVKFFFRGGGIQTFSEFYFGGFFKRPFFDFEGMEGPGGRGLWFWCGVKAFAF